MTQQSDAQHLADQAGAMVAWAQAHAGDRADTVLVPLRRQARLARQLAEAATRPQAIAIYGASQAGKSYLTSGLSTPQDDALIITYGTRRMDFLAQINPTGGGESSGLVSRFTCHPPTPPYPDHAVPVRLLSAVDVIRILGNTFMSDIDLDPPCQPAWAQVETEIAGLRRVEGAGVFTIDDIESISEYFEARFRNRGPAAEYWAWLARHVQDLPLDSALQALSLIWGRIDALTAYARPLLDALFALGQPRIAFCTVDALEPREASILNVTTLFEAPAGVGPVRITSKDGQSATIPRNIISAVIAELVVPMATPRWPFMAQTDLLDFPGARSRLLITKLHDVAANCGQLFLRGKVDYLFARYQADLDITAVLLCVADSAQEVSVLPKMIEGWINEALGDSPLRRAAQEDALFLILTKFDRQFEEKTGADETSAEGWDKRIEASITKFFQSPWIDEWKPGRPFDNVQWLRASTVGSLYRRDERRFETEMLPETLARIKRAQGGYRASGLVRRHVRDPDRAYEEAMLPNDGGISYLAGRLKVICDAHAKQGQLARRMQQCRSTLLDLMRPLYHDADAANAGEQERANGRAMVLKLRPIFDNRLFGALLLSLGLDRETVIAAWRAHERDLSASPSSTAADDDIFVQLGAQPGSQEDEYDRFAKEIMTLWRTGPLETLSTDPRIAETFRVTPGTLRDLAGRISDLATETGLEREIAEQLRRQCSHGGQIARNGEKQALICVEAIGRLVTYLGYAGRPAGERPPRASKVGAIFDTTPVPSGYPKLSKDTGQYLRQFAGDWLTALLARIMQGGPRYDVAANDRLGIILKDLQGRYA